MSLTRRTILNTFHTTDNGVGWNIDNDGDIEIDPHELTIYLSSSDLHNMLAVQTDLESAKEDT